ADAVPGDFQLPPGPPAAPAGDDDGHHPAGIGVDDQIGVVDDPEADPLVDVDDLLAGQVAVAHCQPPALQCMPYKARSIPTATPAGQAQPTSSRPWSWSPHRSHTWPR